jgi:hypothetical protein
VTTCFCSNGQLPHVRCRRHVVLRGPIPGFAAGWPYRQRMQRRVVQLYQPSSVRAPEDHRWVQPGHPHHSRRNLRGHHSGLCWCSGLVHVRGADLFRGLLSSILAWFASAKTPHRSPIEVEMASASVAEVVTARCLRKRSARLALSGQRCVVTPAALGLATTRRFRLEACSACRSRHGPCADSRSSPDEKRPRPRRPRERDRRP